ncbi:MAG: hypothetical protein A2808_00495 [Candidatus Moranbacteria bacterium RIFCSPHIGHO2_01_FULL_55_24]|nr:MAG: hypothetical protein A2808_00495 [Candidatus Moranbacteria bacterium RIFCSPHIGHO2_01_FULL_55_24]
MLVGVGVFFIGAHSYLRWQGNHYFGEVIQITESGFVLSDAKAHERIIDTDKQTVVKEGVRTQQDGLQIGDQVIVVGEEKATGHIKAVLIRIIEDRKEDGLLRDESR